MVKTGGLVISHRVICYLQSGYSKDKDLCLVVIDYMSLFLWLRLGILWLVIVLYVTFSVDIVGCDFCMVLNHSNPTFCMSMVKARVLIWWLVIVHDVSHSTLQKKQLYNQIQTFFISSHFYSTWIHHQLVFSGVRVTRSFVLYVCFVDRCLSFCSFSHCVVCPSSIYGFWLPLWYLQTLLL